MPVDTLSEAIAAQQPPAVTFGHQHLDDLAPSTDQFGQFLCLGIAQGPRLWVDGLAEVGDDGGIKGVGLGKTACGSSEVPDLARIDDGERQAGRREGCRHRHFEAACGFHDDQGRRQGLQPIGQGGQALMVTTDGEGLAAGTDMDIEPVLGDVDADTDLFHDPTLQMRTRLAVRATVRVGRNSGRSPMLSHGL